MLHCPWGTGKGKRPMGYFHPWKWEVATPRRGVSCKGMVATETKSTETSRSIDSPAGCSPSPLADLSQITVTSQWGTGHLQQSQHLIKPSLPMSSPSQASSGTVPIRKATDRFLILFPFPPLDWECLVQQLSSQQLQGGCNSEGLETHTLSVEPAGGWAVRTGPDSQRGCWVPILCNSCFWSYTELWPLISLFVLNSLPIQSTCFPNLWSSCGCRSPVSLCF